MVDIEIISTSNSCTLQLLFKGSLRSLKEEEFPNQKVFSSAWLEQWWVLPLVPVQPTEIPFFFSPSQLSPSLRPKFMVFLTSWHSISHILVTGKPNSVFSISLYHCSTHLGRGFNFSVILRIKSVIHFFICYFRYLLLLCETLLLMVSRVSVWLYEKRVCLVRSDNSFWQMMHSLHRHFQENKMEKENQVLDLSALKDSQTRDAPKSRRILLLHNPIRDVADGSGFLS